MIGNPTFVALIHTRRVYQPVRHFAGASLQAAELEASSGNPYSVSLT